MKLKSASILGVKLLTHHVLSHPIACLPFLAYNSTHRALGSQFKSCAWDFLNWNHQNDIVCQLVAQIWLLYKFFFYSFKSSCAYIFKSEKVAQSCPVLCEPTDYTVHEILQARILEWVVFPFSRGSSQPRDQIQISHTAGGFFTSWATREAHIYRRAQIFHF